LESRKRVLWVVEAVAPVTADLDAPGLAGKKAQGHMRSGSCHMCPERATSAASSVLATRPAPSGLDHCIEALHNPVVQLCNNKARRRGEGRRREGRATMLHWKTGKVALLAAAALAGC